MRLLDDVRLTVVVEGKPPTCYGCGQKGHIKRMCPLNILHEVMKTIENLSQDERNNEETNKVEETTELEKRKLLFK